MARGPWGAGITWQAQHPSYGGLRRCARGACQPIPNSQGLRAKRSIGIYTSL